MPNISKGGWCFVVDYMYTTVLLSFISLFFPPHLNLYSVPPGAALEEHLILDNRYTEHSTVGLAQQWDQLDQLSMRMQHNLEQQIQARNHSGTCLLDDSGANGKWRKS